MRKNILLLLVLVTSVAGLAQSFNIGLEGAYDFNHIGIEPADHQKKSTSTGESGYKVATLAEWTWKSNMTFTTGAAYVTKDGILEDEFEEEYIDYNSVGYIQIPVELGYRFKLPKGFSIMPQVGVYGELGLNGNVFFKGVEYKLIPGTNITAAHPFEGHYNAFKPKDMQPYHPVSRIQWGTTYAISMKYKNFGVKLAFDQALSHSVAYLNGKHRTFYASAILWLK